MHFFAKELNWTELPVQLNTETNNMENYGWKSNEKNNEI